MILTRASLYLNAILLVACLLVGAMWRYELAQKKLVIGKYARAEVAAQIAAREAEHRQAQAIARVAEQYEQDKRAADEAQRKLVADLRAGTVRLQKRWAGCVSATPAGSGQPDAGARDREESVGRIGRAARDADDTIRALQDILRAERAGQGSKPVR